MLRLFATARRFPVVGVDDAHLVDRASPRLQAKPDRAYKSAPAASPYIVMGCTVSSPSHRTGVRARMLAGTFRTR